MPEGARGKLFESNRDCRMHIAKRRPNAGKAAMWARFVPSKKQEGQPLTVFSRQQAAAV